MTSNDLLRRFWEPVPYDAHADLRELCLLDDDLAPDWLLQQTDRSGVDWLWTGPRLARRGAQDSDRAIAKRHGKATTAARHVWTEMRGPLPAHLLVRTVCQLPLCVRPSHLALGTRADAAQDALRRAPLAR